jgi:beta-glucosidase
MEKFKLGLFENPYVDVDAAEKIVGNAKFQERADLAFRKSIVLLRNETNTLPLKTKTKIYFESYYNQRNANAVNIYPVSDDKYNITFVNTPAEADVILLWITPAPKALFQSDGSPLFLSLSKNGVEVAHINSLTAMKPTILAVNYTNPWVIGEIYNEKTMKNIKSVIATFNTTPEALLDIVTGKFNPTGKMPFTTPVSEEVVTKQLSDVPGYLKGKDYPLFKYNEGISYH